jgi:hypothetical protein
MYMSNAPSAETVTIFAVSVTAFLSTHGLFEYNTSYGSGDAGFYVGNSPNADFFQGPIQHGFCRPLGDPRAGFVHGSVTDNLLHDSCSGLVFLNTGTTTGVHNWRASHNIVAHNDKFCSAEAAELPFSLTGVGILIGRRRPHRASGEQGALEPPGW